MSIKSSSAKQTNNDQNSGHEEEHHRREGAEEPQFLDESRGPRDHIYVGKKPVMSYAMSALMQLSQLPEVTVKARGLSIGRAVDVAEIVTKRLGNGVFKLKGIKINTEEVKSIETGEMRNVSSIEIVIGK